MISLSRKTRVFWPSCLLLLLADCTSKDIVEQLSTPHVAVSVIGVIVRFTLAFNPNAAMGISLGSFSRVGFGLAALIAICVVVAVYRRTPPTHTWQTLALALVCGGAAGNLLDRLRSSRGVVDFIDVGIGTHRFYIFNLADAGLCVGATMLAIMLWRNDRAEAESAGVETAGVERA